jgi:hypothetical protein
MPKEAIYTTILAVPSTEPILEDAPKISTLNTTTMEVFYEKPAAGNWEKFSAQINEVNWVLTNNE